MRTDKKKAWAILFYILVGLYIINLISIFTSGNCIFMQSSDVYNYASAVLDAIFLIIFYNFLKSGSLTIRYLGIMFGILVVLPFLTALIFGGVSFG